MNCDQRSDERIPVLNDARSPAGVCQQANAHRDWQRRAPLCAADSDSVLARAFSALGVASERCKATNRPGLYPRSRSHASGREKYFGRSTTRDMPRGARDRIGEDRAAAEQPHTPCSGAKLPRRSATSTNAARLAGNAWSFKRRCRLRLASRQQRFLKSPPQAGPRRRERPAEAKARRRGRRWCVALLALQMSLFQGLGIVAECAVDIGADRRTSIAQPVHWKTPERAWRAHGRFLSRRQSC